MYVDTFSSSIKDRHLLSSLFPCCQPVSSTRHGSFPQVSDTLFLCADFAHSLTHTVSLSLGRLADELRVEQEHGISASKAAKSLHGQVHSLLCSVAFIPSE